MTWDPVDIGVFVLSSSDELPVQSLLFGHGYSEEAVVIGTDGLREYVNSGNRIDDIRDGRFLQIEVTDSHVVVRPDSRGQECIWYVARDEYWALSNSFRALCEKLQTDGVPLDFRAAPVRAMLGGELRNVAAQLVSGRTVVADVFLLPIGKRIEIDRGSRVFRSVDDAIDTMDPRSFEEYVYNLECFARGALARIEALFHAGYAEIALALSGGQDSRICLGLLTALGRLHDVRITTDADKTSDYTVVRELAAHFGVSVNQSSDVGSRPVSVSGAVRLWDLGCGGVYAPVYPPQIEREAYVAHIGGASPAPVGYVYRDPDYLRDRLSRAAEDPRLTRTIREEWRYGLEQLEGSTARGLEMFEHFNEYRVRLHCGRNWYKSLRGDFYTPLITPRLKSAYAYSIANGKGKNQVVFDLLSLLDRRMLDIRFDEAAKNPDDRAWARAAAVAAAAGPCTVGQGLTVYGKRSQRPKRVWTAGTDDNGQGVGAELDRRLAVAMDDRKFVKSVGPRLLQHARGKVQANVANKDRQAFAGISDSVYRTWLASSGTVD